MHACCSVPESPKTVCPGFPRSVNPATSDYSAFLPASGPGIAARKSLYSSVLACSSLHTADDQYSPDQRIYTRADAGTHAVRRCAFRGELTCERDAACHSGHWRSPMIERDAILASVIRCQLNRAIPIELGDGLYPADLRGSFALDLTSLKGKAARWGTARLGEARWGSVKWRGTLGLFVAAVDCWNSG